MKIAILSDKLTIGGGAERYLHDIADAFLDDGHEVVCCALKCDPAHPLLRRPGFRLRRQNLSACPRKLRHIFFDKFLRRELAREGGCDRVIAVASPHSPQLAICVGTHLGDMLARKSRCANPLNWVRVFYERRKYREARRVVAHSHAQADELRRLFGVAPDALHVLWPPVADSFAPDDGPPLEARQRARARCGLPAERRLFLFVSGGHRRKGLGTIIEAFDLLGRDDCRVLVAGAGRGRFPQSRYVEYLGRRLDMPDLYRACDATLLLSDYEPFGLSVAESLLCGTPVFVTPQVGARDILAGGPDGGPDPGMGHVVPLGDAPALAQAMREFLRAPHPFPRDTLPALRDTLSVKQHARTLLDICAAA